MAFKEAKKIPLSMATLIGKFKLGEMFKSPVRPLSWEARIFPKGIIVAK